LTDLDYVRLASDTIAIGAMTRHATLLASPVLAEHYPIFADAERVIADPVVRPAEILTEVRIPIRPGAGSAYEKVERRAGDWGATAGGCFVVLAADGETVVYVGIGLTAVGAPHFCAEAAEAVLRGRPATAENLAAAAAAAAEVTNPQTDQRGPAEYKRHLAGELTRRALRRAVARARGQEA